jgi:hypothetical protein
VSLTAVERVLLPTSRTAAPETIILANGFSCREQIDAMHQPSDPARRGADRRRDWSALVFVFLGPRL